MARTRHMFRAWGRAAAIALPALLAGAAMVPAQAQISLSIGIGFDNFHNRLAPYGSWSNHPRWGQVWHPRAARDFRPYYNGHWVNTREYGWMWVSDESWGDITYHYGRWVRDPREGWLWVPGYVWGPSWVVWRSGGGNIGWFPMPPGDDYYGDGAYRGNFDDEYGYRDWYGSEFRQQSNSSRSGFLSAKIILATAISATMRCRSAIMAASSGRPGIRPTTPPSTIMSSIAASTRTVCSRPPGSVSSRCPRAA